MKTSMKFISAIFAVIIVGGGVISLPVMQSQIANAQSVPVPVIVNPVAKQYRVVDISRMPNATSLNLAESIEKGLNDLGSQGWTVVTVSGSYLILMR